MFGQVYTKFDSSDEEYSISFPLRKNLELAKVCQSLDELLDREYRNMVKYEVIPNNIAETKINILRKRIRNQIKTLKNMRTAR